MQGSVPESLTHTKNEYGLGAGLNCQADQRRAAGPQEGFPEEALHPPADVHRGMPHTAPRDWVQRVNYERGYLLPTRKLAEVH